MRKVAQPDSVPRIDPEVGEIDDEPGKALHDRIIEMRNEAVAHSAFKRYPVQIIKRQAPQIGIRAGGGVTVSRAWHVTQENLDLESFEHLAPRLQGACALAVIEDLMRRPAAEDGNAEP
jgi:hypothetical protein